MSQWVHCCAGLGYGRAVAGAGAVDGAGAGDQPCRCSSSRRGRQAGCGGCGWY